MRSTSGRVRLRPFPLTALALVALAGVGCAETSDAGGGGNAGGTNGDAGVGGVGGTCIYLPTGEVDPSQFQTLDFRGFDSFHLSRHRSLDFCPDPDQLFTASIVKDSDGGYTFTYTLLEDLGPSGEMCLSCVSLDILNPNCDSCLVEGPSESRPLSPAEVERVNSAFSVVRAADCQEDEWACGDYCLATHFTWDSEVYTDDCNRPWWLEDLGHEILDLLEQLRRSGE